MIDANRVHGVIEMKGILAISMESIMVAAMIAPAMSEDVSMGADVGDVALIYDCWAGCEDSPCYYLDGCCDGEQDRYEEAGVFKVAS